METTNPIVQRALYFDAALRLIMQMPEEAREPVVLALAAYLDNKPYAEDLFENCDS
jgi:hypothetical protein